jgi:hypothetical protein
MPPDRSRFSNPQGRQKSCSECAKAKRRCDLRQPHCIRCTRQKLTCVYPPRPNASCSIESPVPVSSAEGIHQESLPPFIYDIDIPEFTAAEVELLDFNFPATTNSNSSCDDPNLDGGLIIDLPSPQPNPPSMRISSVFPMATLSPQADSRVGYSFEQMKLAPKMFVEKNATPWSHPVLYEDYMPKLLQGHSPLLYL